MSHAATKWAFSFVGIKCHAKMVLLHLADHHNPDYGCFPSQKTLAEKCGMTERSVRDQIKYLCEIGLIVRSKRFNSWGVRTSDDYALNFSKMTLEETDSAPELRPEPESEGPEPDAKSGRNVVPGNMVKEITGKERVNTRERATTISDSQKIKEVLEEFASPESVLSFKRFRVKIKKPLTVTAAKRIANTLAVIQHRGGDPDDALGMCEERGWQSIKPDWYFRDAGTSQKSDDQKQIDEFNRLAGE
jgi:helix-turn-helix protein